MTIKELRNEAKEQRDFLKHIDESLVEYSELIWKGLEELYKNGFVNLNEVPYGDDILSCANGYQINTENYETFHVSQTYDIKVVSATKTATKELMAFWLHI